VTDAGDGESTPRDSRAALVIGYGNALRSDDGLGWHAAALLAADPRLSEAEVMWRHQLTPELASDISRASLVVLIDVSVEQKTGAVAVRRIEATSSAGSAWSHHVDPESLVALARELWSASPEVFVVSVGAGSLEVGEHLSPAVEAALPKVIETVVNLVSEHEAGA
jgi:hydrogenase maturation protease